MSMLHAMIHLPEGLAPEDKFSIDTMMGDDFEAAQRRFRDSHIAEARRNSVFRERILENVEEAARLGII